MATRQTLTDQHSFLNDTIFRTKTYVLTIKRYIKNIFSPVKRFRDEEKLLHHAVISFSETDLWNPFDNIDNWILTAGKIENLRIAARKLNGIEVRANEIFSFWKHIGNPNFGKGFVVGREIREGCIVPTIAGGLCQLSNALYDAALKANFQIVERHKHTKVIKGSLAEQDRDATVKWNYVDLRFKSSFDFRIEVSLTSDKLLVVFKSQEKSTVMEEDPKTILHDSDKLNDCYSCGNLACYKHPGQSVIKQEMAITAFILDERWPEYDDYIKSISNEKDHFILPLKKNRFLKTNRYAWSVKNSANLKTTDLQGWARAMKLRMASKTMNNIFELTLRLDKKIAWKASTLIPIEATHLVISQNLLPFLHETGALGGRTYDVLMTRLPIGQLHERLDLAFKSFPESKTLKDFRAPEKLITLENKALTRARKIITPHAEIAALFHNKAIRLNWTMPEMTKVGRTGNKILFPASALGRKGAYEIKKLARELNLSIVLTGSAIESDGFWENLSVERFDGSFEKIELILYPTYIEHQPRQLLKAIAKGIPVITSTAAGLEQSNLVKVIPVGDYSRLLEEVKRHQHLLKISELSETN